MSILVFGKTGQVATELQIQGDVIALDRDSVDLTNPKACADAITAHKPRAVINAAAHTAVDKAETEEALATLINGTAPTAMAQACAASGIPFVHISTDYIFDGTGERPWQPTDTPAPLGVYGRSKLAGEIGVQAAGGCFAILRTSWVFSTHGNNFVKTMLRLSETRDSLNVVGDQIGGPTPAADIARACLEMAEQLIIDPSKSGVYHFSGAPDVSWKDFAIEVFDRANREVIVSGIPTSAYPTPAVRPLNSRMDCTTTDHIFGVPRPNWKTGLQTVLDMVSPQS